MAASPKASVVPVLLELVVLHPVVVLLRPDPEQRAALENLPQSKVIRAIMLEESQCLRHSGPRWKT